VSIIRKKQFILIKPATKTRIDLGLKLKDKPTTERLENSGPFGPAHCKERANKSVLTRTNPLNNNVRLIFDQLQVCMHG